MAAKLDPLIPKLRKMLAMLSSPEDGDVVNAARALGRALEAIGADFNDLAARVETPMSDAEAEEFLKLAESEARKRVMAEYREFLAKAAVQSNGSYDLLEIALYLQRRKDRVEPYWHEPLDRWAAKLTVGQFPLTEKEQKRLLALFRQAGGKLE